MKTLDISHMVHNSPNGVMLRNEFRNCEQIFKVLYRPVLKWLQFLFLSILSFNILETANKALVCPFASLFLQAEIKIVGKPMFKHIFCCK